MRLLVLGSGGNTPIPLPTCGCAVCREARERGVPYARHGNSLFLRELNAVVDAPEFAFTNLNREGIDRIDYVFLTHWHPDHINGLRIVQSHDMAGRSLAEDGLFGIFADDRPTVVTTRGVYERVRDRFAQVDHFVDEAGFADVHFLDEEPLDAGEIAVEAIPYPLEGEDADEDATAFVFEEGDRTLVAATDDARYLDESALPDDPDVAVFECGLFAETTDGKPILDALPEWFVRHELSHGEVRERIERVDPGLAILTEIEHLNARGHDDYRELESGYDRTRFAYDGMEIEI